MCRRTVWISNSASDRFICCEGESKRERTVSILWEWERERESRSSSKYPVSVCVQFDSSGRQVKIARCCCFFAGFPLSVSVSAWVLAFARGLRDEDEHHCGGGSCKSARVVTSAAATAATHKNGFRFMQSVLLLHVRLGRVQFTEYAKGLNH